METQEAWSKLIEWAVPGLVTLLDDPETPKSKTGSVYEVGLFDYDAYARRTRSGSFSRVCALHPELGPCMLWYSYRTCICKMSLEYGLILKTTKYYTRTTYKHLASVNWILYRSALVKLVHYNGDVGNEDGELTPEVIVRTAHDQVVSQLEAFPRIRLQERWADNLHGELSKLEIVCSRLSVRVHLPATQQVLTEKAGAKLLGTYLINPQVAEAVARYNSLRKELAQ